MKKRVIKGVVVAVLAMGIFASGVFASTLLEPITAYLNKEISLTWNDDAFYPSEADGTRVYPITYNGRTYVPAKFIAEKAGLELTWDVVNKKVSFYTGGVTPTVTPTPAVTPTPVVTPTAGVFEGYFASVPKPVLDSSFTEITITAYKDWTVGTNKAYTMYKQFKGSNTQIATKTQEYKNLLVSNGFSLYKIYANHYTYTKGDIAVIVFAAYDAIDIRLTSGYQAEHIGFTTPTTPTTPVVTPTAGVFEGYFASVPKPVLDSSFTEITATAYKDWTVGTNKAYTMYKHFKGPNTQIATKTQEYKNLLVSNGFSLYKIYANHYTYTKGDIAVTVFAAYDTIDIRLASGYQAEHID